MIPSVPTLHSERFRLRPLVRDDARALFPTLGDPQQCLYLTRPAFGSEEELWGWLAEPGWNGRTWIAEDGEGEVVARVVAVPTEDPEIEEIGYITCTHRQGEGIAHECTTALLAHLLDEEGKREITAEVDAKNTASIRLLDRLGFQRSALHLAFEETHKGVCDVAIYTLSRERWAEREG